jgi:1-acyl-sn-glycerol-3-phosphate acyltransferase
VADLVYPPVVLAGHAFFAALGMRFVVDGAENLPRSGGAVLASNHVSYLDFTFLGYAAWRRRRLVRFMAKDVVFRHWFAGPFMRGMHHIPVDRRAGSQAFRDAVQALRGGEVVGVFPEATISRSFEVKGLKPGAVRMAQATGVPIVPAAVWGGQRIYTKGRSRDWSRGKTIMVLFGEPLQPERRDDTAEVVEELSERIRALVGRAQREYPEVPSGEDDRWWLPAAMGGTAPTPEEAAALDSRDPRGD